MKPCITCGGSGQVVDCGSTLVGATAICSACGGNGYIDGGDYAPLPHLPHPGRYVATFQAPPYTPIGWRCPVCGIGVAPTMTMCPRCAADTTRKWTNVCPPQPDDGAETE